MITADQFRQKYFGTLDGEGNIATKPQFPAFRLDVTVRGVFYNDPRNSQPVNPIYCATNRLASDLRDLVDGPLKPVVVFGLPQGGWPTANVYTSDDVAWIEFSGFNRAGVAVKIRENAGMMAAWFNHGMTATDAFNGMMREVMQDMNDAPSPE